MLRQLKDSGLTRLLAEQNVQMALAASDYAYVLREGHIEIEGNAADVRRMEEVRRTFPGL